MTEQEKIKLLLQMGVGRTNLGNHEESKIISRALERQIPKKVIYKATLYCWETLCPMCAESLSNDNYCRMCGQALKRE